MIRSHNATTAGRERHGRCVRFSPEAQRAIARGVQRDDPVANLEYLGFAVRNINILEGSHHQITKLHQLVNCSREELLQIPNFGRSALDELLECLSRYDELEEAKRRMVGPRIVKPEWFEGKQVVGVTAGASAPELLVQRVVARLKDWGGEGAEELSGRAESVVFALPRELRSQAAG